MNRREKQITVGVVAGLLTLFGVIAVASAKPKEPIKGVFTPPQDPKPKPGFDPWDPGSDKPDEPSDDPVAPKGDECPAGFEFRYENLPNGAGRVRTCVPIDVGPPKKIDDIIKIVPVPGSFYQVRKGDIFLGKKVSAGDGNLSICYMALRRAAHDAAMLHGGLSDADAWKYVNSHSSTIGSEKDSLRPYLALLECGWWNDEVYGSWKYTQGKATPNAHGRAIGLNPQHAPNLDRMRAGQAPARNVPLGSPTDKGKGPAIGVNKAWHEYPALWIPEIDLKAYYESGLKTIITAGTWSDGSDRSSPPPEVADRGVDDVSHTVASGTTFGCGSGSMEVG